MRIIMTDVLISSYSTGGASGDARELALTPDAFRFDPPEAETMTVIGFDSLGLYGEQEPEEEELQMRPSPDDAGLLRIDPSDPDGGVDPIGPVIEDGAVWF